MPNERDRREHLWKEAEEQVALKSTVDVTDAELRFRSRFNKVADTIADKVLERVYHMTRKDVSVARITIETNAARLAMYERLISFLNDTDL